MAAAEATASWQRTSSNCTSNSCFIPEDAKRDPNLSSCPSSSSSSKSEFDGSRVYPANEPDHTAPACLSHKPNFNVPTNAKWWLHPHPNHGHQKDFTYEQLIALEAELESLITGFVSKSAEISQDNHPFKEFTAHTDIKEDANSCLEQPLKVSAACMKNDQVAKRQELQAVLSNDIQKSPKKDMEYWFTEAQMKNSDSFNCLISEETKKLSSDLGSHWMGAGKTEPWWRTAGKDELASLVAQKSLDYVENCDLPQPQTKHFGKGVSACLGCLEHDEMLALSLDQKAELGLSYLASVNMEEKQHILGDVGRRLHNSYSPFGYNNCHCVTNKDQAGAQNIPDKDSNKAQLLEALCHSQTRAREAEKAAQQAYTEKEHIITLFFRQAAQLFAYKQWLQLLQIEKFCLQLKNQDHPISTLFPAVLAWVPYRGQKTKKGQHKAANRKRGHRSGDFSRCAVAFAVGLSLASAGLLLGWTMGWLFPAL